MRNYETMVVLQPQLTEEQVKSIIERITDLIKDGGELLTVEEWGVRNLAYKINNQFTEGYYILITFKAEPEVLENLQHYYKITDEVIRSIIINTEK